MVLSVIPTGQAVLILLLQTALCVLPLVSSAAVLDHEVSCSAFFYILPWKGVKTQPRNHSGSRGVYVSET